MRTSNERMSLQLAPTVCHGMKEQLKTTSTSDMEFAACRTPAEGMENCQAEEANYRVARSPKLSSRESVRNSGASFRTGVLLKTCGGQHSPLSETHHHSGSGSTPPLSEQEQTTPPHMRWARNLKNLLNDKEGVDLFTKFLTQEGCGSESISFFYACEGMKKRYAPGCKDQQQAIKVIYKTYIKAAKIQVGEIARQEIVDKINSRVGIDESIFDRAQKELEENYLQNAYHNFLKSDLYLQHVQKMQQYEVVEYDDEEISRQSLSSNSASRETLNFLPTVHEDKELSPEPVINPNFVPFAQRESRHSSRSSRYVADLMRYHPEPGYFPRNMPGRYSNSSHLKYAGYLPASTQDSELQSLSSDAQTDDTMSITTEGSSLSDGVPSYSSRSYCRKQQRAMKRNASLNRESLLNHAVIPRTQCIVPDRIAEKEPSVFASILVEKLGKIKKDIDGCAKLNESLRQLDLDDGKGLTQYGGGLPQSHHQEPEFERFTKIPHLLFNTAAMAAEDNGQSILDQHVSRVWNDSNCQSPLSPGQQSPPAPLDRRRIGVSTAPPHSWGSSVPSGYHGQLVLPNPYTSPRNIAGHPPHYNTNRSRRERDACSSDSGTVHDFTPENEPALYPPYPIHYHKHVHHHTSSGIPQATTEEVSINSRRVKESSRRSSVKKSTLTDSSSSCVDSGVSVCDPCPPASHEKVYSWVLDNEKYTYNRGPDSDKDSSTRHKKSSHSSLSTHSSVPGKQNSSKKPVMYNASRPCSLDYSSASWPRQPSESSGANNSAATPSGGFLLGFPQPAQPVAQDPCMPILPPPDTMSQLFEAKRRLEDEAAKGKLNKAKSTVSKSKPSSKVIDNFEDGTTLRKSSKRVPSISSNSNNNNNQGGAALVVNVASGGSGGGGGGSGGASEVTVIGYCFSGESVPYRTKMAGKNITLKQFKSLLSKKGNYRYFFKRSSNEFGTGVVNEEVSDDNEILPLWEGKIFCTIDPVSE